MPSSRNRAWADRVFNITGLVAGTPQAFDLLSNAPVVDTLTVVRTVGEIVAMYSPNSTVVDSLSTISMGVCVVSDQAFGVAGAAAIPNPAAEDDYPPRGWLYVATQPVSQQAESTGVLNVQAIFKFDIGAMRKIDKGKLVLVMKQDNILVGGNMRLVGRVRSLCLT